MGQLDGNTGAGSSIGYWLLGGLAVASLALVVYWLLPEDSATRAGVGRAVRQFRLDMSETKVLPLHRRAPIPPFGVYRYRTRGSEKLETRAFTATHTYDGVSTVALTPNDCGVTERWQPLVERWFEGRLCLGPSATRVVSVRDYHEFFGESRLVRYRCGGGSAPYSALLRPGDGWRTRCAADAGAVVSDVRVVGIEPVRVAGRQIEAVHLRSRATMSGDPQGSDRQESWLRRSDGLLLRRVDRSRADVDVEGGGTFEERYEIALISTRPRR